MRSRNIKPGFFKNEILAECDPLARVLFAGLWCMADREGRLEYRPKRIKAEILPYDDCKIDVLLNQLLQNGFIIVYSIDGANYLSIPTFTEHQNCNIKEAASIIPAPNEHGASMVQKLPLTEYLLPHTSYPTPLTTKPRFVKPANPDGFEKFWAAYPKKKAKKDAVKAFTRINPDETLLEAMLTAIDKAKKSEDWSKDDGRYIPHPATWLNGQRWLDQDVEIDPMSSAVSTTTRHNIGVLQNWRPPSERCS